MFCWGEKESDIMADKKNILDSWIMVELLSEGDINKNNKEFLNFDDLNEGDYFSFFKKTYIQKS